MKLSDAKNKKQTKSTPPEPTPPKKKAEPAKPDLKVAAEILQESEEAPLMKVKEIIRPKQKKSAAPAVGAHLPPEPIVTEKPAPVKSKKLDGPCEVVDCPGSDDMMKYEGRVICGAHFKTLCDRRDLNPKRQIELDDVCKLRPKAAPPKKVKGRRADPDSPWAKARVLILSILKGAKSGGIGLPEVLESLIATGWEVPATNNTVRGTLHTVLTNMTADGVIVKIGRGRFGPALS
jgi:hypothetical protein